jgi:hypothetical protein
MVDAAQPGQNQEARHQWQATQRFMGSRLPPAPLGFLASALGEKRVDWQFSACEFFIREI